MSQTKSQRVMPVNRQRVIPYSKSFGASKYPLELVFFYVWGPALDSVGGKKNTTSVLLMTLVNSHGFTSLNINQKCLTNSMNSKASLRECLALV